MPEDRKSISDIALEIKAHWQKCENELERAKDNPHLMELVNRKIVEQMAHLIGTESHNESLTVLRHQPSVHSTIKELLSGIAAQSRQTASLPRPKPKPTIRSLTVDAMKIDRAQGRSFSDFIEGAKENSVRGISFKSFISKNTEQFKISVEKNPNELAKEAGRDDNGNEEGAPLLVRSRKTLEKWWQEADKSK